MGGSEIRHRAVALLLLSVAPWLLAGCGARGAQSGDGEAPAVRRTVVLLGDAAEASLPPETAAALAWLRSQPDIDARFLQLADLAVRQPPAEAILWWHHSRSAALPSAAMNPETLATARLHLQEGGHLLLSLFAATWVVPLGLETRAPNQVERVAGTDFARWGPDDDRVLAGFQSYRGHPLLRRFWGGTYTATPDKERRYPVARYTGDAWPEGGAVVAVAKKYIGIDPGRRILVEYAATPERPGGRVLTVGEALWFADPDNHGRQQLELFTHDLLAYLAGELPPAPQGASIATVGAVALPATQTMAAEEPTAPLPPGTTDSAAPEPSWSELPGVLAATTYWAPRAAVVRRFTPVATSSPTPASAGTVLDAVSAARSGLALEAPASSEVPFDLHGPSTLVVGRQSGDVEDVWAYPVRILRHLRFGVETGDGAVLWLDDPDATRSFVARPEGDTLRVTRGATEVSLHLAVPRDQGALVVLVAVRHPRPVRLLVQFEADHAPMWPREADHLDGLQLGWDASAHAAVWRDPTGTFTAYAGFGRAAETALPGTLRELTAPRPAPTAASAAPVTDAGTAPSPATSTDADRVDPGATDGDLESDAGDPVDALPDAAVDVDVLPSSRVAMALEVDPAVDEVVPFVVVGATGRTDTARADYLRLLDDPAAVWTSNANHWRQFLAETLDIATPDPTFDEAFRWAKVGLEAFRMTTPGMGTGLLAGYAASKEPATDTWHADNDFLRRPGYGWYFGRDAVWTAFAADAYGGTDLTAQALRFLARYQDVDGKILHEMSPGWALHYDAADSTPLFLLGLDHHVRATGDRDLLRVLWPAVRRAMRYLDSTDTDGDGLIENTDVGHGWIEGGRFYGAHTTLYLASLWGATLEAVERMATWMGDSDLATSAGQRVGEVRRILDTDFWDAGRRTYYHGKMADGRFMPIRTILPAVPMYFGLLSEARVRPLLEMFAGAEISTDWGARMAESSNPDYDPEGYHDGSVWPLFSGWTSLAGYRYHRPLSAFTHLNQNLRLYRSGNLGYLPEVLHGDRFESIGVTSHQAWSQAMAILPAVEGMLGIRPDAPAGRLRIHPHLPGGWAEATVQRVRVGASSFKVTVRREDETTSFVVERLAGSEPIQLELSLPFPRAVLVNLDRDATTGVALVEGETIVDHPSEKEALVVVTLSEPIASIVFRHSPFPSLMPVLPSAEPGAPSGGLRIVGSNFNGRVLSARVEGIPGRAYRLSLSTPWPVAAVRGVPEATVLNSGPRRAAVEIVLPGTSSAYRRVDLQIEFRQ